MTLDEFRAQATVCVGDANTWPPPIGTFSMTLEDAEFLYALVRTVKPKLVAETGTGLGASARFIAEALHENGFGRLVTYERTKEYADQARPLLDGLPAEVIHGALPLSNEPDIVHIDSAAGLRAEEITKWLSSDYQGLVIVHDANRRYDELAAGTGVFIPGSDGFWVGRP
jgi:predicted O-methyltransferase YrrM